jgi:hypothetical protein
MDDYRGKRKANGAGGEEGAGDDGVGDGGRMGVANWETVAVGQKKKQFEKTNTTTERVGKRSGASRFDHPAGNRSGKKWLG